MRKSSIVITTLIGIVALVFLGMPLMFGFTLQAKYPAVISQLSNNTNAELKLISYHRGWFTSQAKLKVTLNDQTVNPKSLTSPAQQPLTQFVVDQTIKHGLVIFTKGLWGHNRFFFSCAVITNTVNSHQIKIKALTEWTLNNQLISNIVVPLLQIDNSGQRILIQNGVGSLNYPLNGTVIQGGALINNFQNWIKKPSAQVSVYEKKLQLNNVRLSFNNHHQDNGLWYGVTSLIIPKGVFYADQGNATTLDSFSFTINQHPMNSSHTAIVLSSRAAQIANSNFNLKNLNVALNLNGLQTSALVNIDKAMEQNKPVYGSILELLAGGLNVNLNPFTFNTNDGPVKLQAQFNFPQQSKNTANPLFWFQAYRQLIAQIQMQMPQASLNKWMSNFYQRKNTIEESSLTIDTSDVTAFVNEQINYWLNNNIIKKLGNNYVTQINLKQGQLLINGALPKTKRYFLSFQPTAPQKTISETVSTLGTKENNTRSTTDAATVKEKK